MAIEVPTFADLYAYGKTVALLRSGKLNEASFSPGYMLDVLLGLDAAVAEEVARFALELHRRTFVRTASAEALDELAADHFGLTRYPGTAAVGKVKFQRANAGFGPLFIEIGTRVATADGLVFETTDPTVLTGLSVVVDVRAQVTGTVGNVAAGAITEVVESLADPTVSVTNSSAPANERLAGGAEPETDEEFRARIRAFLATLRRGTSAALAFGATVAGVKQATVDDTVYPPTVYIADAGGSANATLRDLVAAELVNWRAAGVQVNVLAAQPVEQAVSLTLTFEAGVDTSAARDRAIAAVVAAVNSLRIGQPLYRASLIAAAKVAGVLNVVVTDPVGDVVPTKEQLIRTSAALVTLGS